MSELYSERINGEAFEVIETSKEIIVVGSPISDDDSHNCDFNGCTTVSHVLVRFNKHDRYKSAFEGLCKSIENLQCKCEYRCDILYSRCQRCKLKAEAERLKNELNKGEGI